MTPRFTIQKHMQRQAHQCSREMGKPISIQETIIHKLELEDGKKYIGKTLDVERRMKEHKSEGTFQ